MDDSHSFLHVEENDIEFCPEGSQIKDIVLGLAQTQYHAAHFYLVRSNLQQNKYEERNSSIHSEMWFIVSLVRGD